MSPRNLKRHFVMFQDGTDEICAAFSNFGNSVEELMNNLDWKGDCTTQKLDCDDEDCCAIHSDSYYILEVTNPYLDDEQNEIMARAIASSVSDSCDDYFWQERADYITDHAVYLPDFNWYEHNIAHHPREYVRDSKILSNKRMEIWNKIYEEGFRGVEHSDKFREECKRLDDELKSKTLKYIYIGD